ncbi:hypothetical protein [Spirosoma validum]|uniref:Secreted protein n=1 Tax=Spirosoma validum TaxID=2771355 RepID=A0A927B073_9BACT|nr:hypothetical protein [Spirosoma validum]MBD2753094.1 hypothetical protein [Spirosoma validum]
MKAFKLITLSLVITLSGVVQAQQVKPQGQPDYPLDSSSTLVSRVQPATTTVLQMFRDAGMSPIEHRLTEDEQKKIAAAFSALPPLHQRILKGRLRSINFLDNMPNTALTSTVNPSGTHKLFDITFRAEILNQDVSEWLTWKELTCFDTTGSTLRVSIQAGHLSAFQYVLLHEATHVVDGTLDITPDYALATGQPLPGSLATDFIANVWTQHTVVASAYKSTLLDGIVFRKGGKPLPISQASQIYQALKQTPFVSLYGRSSWHEDLAEYVTVYHFTQTLGQPFTITEGQPTGILLQPHAVGLSQKAI